MDTFEVPRSFAGAAGRLHHAVDVPATDAVTVRVLPPVMPGQPHPPVRQPVVVWRQVGYRHGGVTATLLVDHRPFLAGPAGSIEALFRTLRACESEAVRHIEIDGHVRMFRRI